VTAIRVSGGLSVSRWVEARTGWSIRTFVKTARRYRTVEIQAGPHVITALRFFSNTTGNTTSLPSPINLANSSGGNGINDFWAAVS
jgi:hypothetical protein